ncbi:hypothetical protein BFN67_15130 [Pseudaminobacter manganicus]|uniref:Integrase catalytic domain-containing protein n=1 Tax=Manganibacter manganicus TaxID=1873176 RepID=A0A1V8RSP6_9HYPH|nr:hypothetical protein BFN67_15130 [Pseudaminobacter manganicus]
MVYYLMITSVERRVGSTRTSHRVEWLSDNGSAYIARQTAQTAAALGLTLLFTPVRSSQSNGMSGSFVKTLKRDYASIHILPDTDTILALLPDWMKEQSRSVASAPPTARSDRDGNAFLRCP